MSRFSYHARLLRHKFAKFSRKGNGNVGGLAAALVIATIGTGSTWLLTSEDVDHNTTGQTGHVVSAIKNDLDALKPAFQDMDHLGNRLSFLYHTNGVTPQQHQEWQEKERVFNKQAIPVLQNILLNPALSEAQAEELMKHFEREYHDPAHINPDFRIRDYGFLREARDEAVRQEKTIRTPAAVLEETSAAISRKSFVNQVGTPLSLIFYLLIGAFAAETLTESRHLQKWAKEKPGKPARFKH